MVVAKKASKIRSFRRPRRVKFTTWYGKLFINQCRRNVLSSYFAISTLLRLHWL